MVTSKTKAEVSKRQNSKSGDSSGDGANVSGNGANVSGNGSMDADACGRSKAMCTHLPANMKAT